MISGSDRSPFLKPMDGHAHPFHWPWRCRICSEAYSGFMPEWLPTASVQGVLWLPVTRFLREPMSAKSAGPQQSIMEATREAFPAGLSCCW